ncbi:MAG: hypothetical protein ACE5EC_03795, partial [Phycisphaerae bacterium]
MRLFGTRLLYQRLKSLLCVTLVLNVHVWLGGCAGWMDPLAPSGEMIRIDLTPDHPISRALAGSAMAGATAVEINPAAQSLHFVYPNAHQKIDAHYSINHGEFVIQEFSFGRQGRSVDMTLDAAKRVTTVRTDDGFLWTRPAKWQSKAASSSGVQGYLNANIELMKVAREDDQSRGITPPDRFVSIPGSDEVVDLTEVHTPDDKFNASQLLPLPPAFAALVAIWAEFAGLLPSLLVITFILSLLQTLLGLVGQPQMEPIPPPDGDGPGPSEPPANDCNGNGEEDADDIANGAAQDCNGNGAPDSCDIAGGASQDCDANGIPDDCATDTDGDGTIDTCDGCPNDPGKLEPGVCGCGFAETAICATVQSDRDWIYEHLVHQSHDVTNCSATFTATIEGDPLGNTTYSYQWTIMPPSDRPGSVFTEISGGTTDQAKFQPPECPAASSSGEPYIVTVTITGDQAGNVGTASFPIDVRVLGDVNGNGGADMLDMDIIQSVEDGTEMDPAMMTAADVNCDGSADG